MDLNFLNDVKLDTIVPKIKASKPAVIKLPTEASIRLFANGRAYPSELFAKAFNLEFQPKTDGEYVGNGLDIFDSKRWGMIKGKLPEELIFIAAVPKGLPKVDMWGSCSYTEENTPKASVLTQGLNTFAKTQFKDMVENIYSINWDVTVFVDLKMDAEHVLASEDKIYYLPKKVSGGKHKGEDTYIRRENIDIYPLVIVHTETKEAKQIDMFADDTETAKPVLENIEVVAETVVVPPVEDSSPPLESGSIIADDTDWDKIPEPKKDIVEESAKEEPMDKDIPKTTPAEDNSLDWAKGLGLD